jgi:hypothetical protein
LTSGIFVASRNKKLFRLIYQLLTAPHVRAVASILKSSKVFPIAEP